ncbi:beta-glucosidase 44 isoform X2 [Daucus carota subsp. sativus]|uniref:beta-glucosidase 44 isoform X2 n=1 Tax=Daucus carota subsp. sativus TaxID=79200 RepID=UPI003082C893
MSHIHTVDGIFHILRITPYANLNHYHLPQALQEKYNGWLGHELVKDFADYEDFCFKTFGDRVKNWMTFKKYVPEHTEEEDWNSLGFCMICTSYKIKG